MDEKVVGLIRTGGVILLFVIGLILMLGAMKTEIDPETNEAVGDLTAVSRSANYIVYLVYGCVGAIILFSIWAIIQNPKKFIPTAIGLGVFAIIAFIGYAMAGSDPIKEVPDATEDALKLGGTAIKTTFLLIFIAVALITVGSVMGIMRYFSK